MHIKNYYLKQFPDDKKLGSQINKEATFLGLRNILYGNHDVYKYIGVGDSVIRERLFEKLAEHINQDYNFVYNLWLSKNK